MLEETQHFQLPEYTFRWDERLKHIGKFLECNSSAIAGICHCPEKYKKKIDLVISIMGTNYYDAETLLLCFVRIVWRVGFHRGVAWSGAVGILNRYIIGQRIEWTIDYAASTHRICIWNHDFHSSSESAPRLQGSRWLEHVATAVSTCSYFNLLFNIHETENLLDSHRIAVVLRCLSRVSSKEYMHDFNYVNSARFPPW